MNFVFFVLAICSVIIFVSDDVYAQFGSSDTFYDRNIDPIKFLDAYFGTIDKKVEVNSGDDNVPFTIVLSNVGLQDIAGIRGHLSMPLGFSSSDGDRDLITSNSDTNAIEGENFHLTFFVNIDDHVVLGQYPATVKIDFSRLRENGERSTFLKFTYKVTGDSVINMRALDPFLVSLKENHVIIEISNDGTAAASAVDIELTNTQSEMASNTESMTNVENVIIRNTNWDVGQIDAGSNKLIETDIYVPESLRGDTFRAPMSITYFNTHGDEYNISRIVDFYVRGLIDLNIYNIGVVDLSGRQTIIGEIINEGNEDALFGFVTVEPLNDSNIKKTQQFIDEIEIDSPVPFNIPIEFDGEPKYGQHDIQITVRYKDDIREENFLIHKDTIILKEKVIEEPESDPTLLIVIPVIIGIVIYIIVKRRRQSEIPA